MYTVYADGAAIHNPATDDPTRLVYNATLTQQANMADSFEFTIYPSNPEAANIHKLSTTVEVYQDSDLLFRGRPIQSKEGWNKQQTITCEGGLAFLNDTIIRPYNYTGSVSGYLQQLISSHNSQVPAAKQFTVRTVTVTDPNNTIVRSNTDYTTTMQEIQEKLVNNLGGYLVPEYTGGQWYLDYLASSNAATSQKITLAKNLIDFLREQNAENIATALIPLGAVDDETGQRITIKSVNSGLDYIVDQTAAATYGLIYTTEIWDDVTVPANLKMKAQARLSDYAALIPTIQLTAVDLSITDQNIEPIRLLDTVTVEDDQHAASGQFLVTQRVYNLSDPAADKVTFGGAVPTMSRAQQKTAAAIEEIPARTLQNASDRARAILDGATDGAIQILYNNDGVAYELRINNSQDPSTATKWWRYNSGGWGYTDDGGQTYTVAATMDGTIFATLIKAGILSSDNGKFYVNLDTGAATLSDVTINGGSINLGPDVFTVSSAGKVVIKGGTTDANANLMLVNASNANYYLSLTPATIGIHAENYEARWVGPTLEVRKNDGQTAYSGTPEWLISRLAIRLAGLYGGTDPNNPFYQINLSSSGLDLKGQNGTTRCKLETTAGLTFYDSSGNATGTYPATNNLGKVDSENGEQISLATGTWKSAVSISLTADKTYLINGIVSFASNASGYRRLLISTTADSSTPINQYSNVVVAAANGLATRPNIFMMYKPGSNTTIYLNVYQNSGSALNTTGYIQAMTIEG